MRTSSSLFIVFMLCGYYAAAQPAAYTSSNAHSHNDYAQPVPFFAAYDAGFGSIEADIFLSGNQLLVGHNTADLTATRTLEKLYLIPLDSCVKAHHGNVYEQAGKKLVLLIDVKTEAVSTLYKLIEILKKYPSLINTPTLVVAISGNRPDASLFDSYPSFIWFDGVLSFSYPKEAMPRIALLSDNLKSYTAWNGNNDLPGEELEKIRVAIQKAHALHKPVRFWNAPDTPTAWEKLVGLRVDYLNTDHITELAAFLRR